jgi:ligand-binding sensor domain-containing protein
MSRKTRHLIVFLLAAGLVGLACTCTSGLLGDKDEETTIVATEAEVTDVQDTEVPEEIVIAAPTEKPTMEPNPDAKRMYTNANWVQDMTLYDDTLYLATLGGVAAWDLQTGEGIKYTALDGLPSNGVYAITVCPMPEPTLVAGTDNGLALFDFASMEWEFGADLLPEELTGDVPPNLYQDWNDILALHCDGANGRLFIEYDGVQILDLESGTVTEWNEYDDGLASSSFNDIAVSDKDIWISSGYYGLSRISSDEVTIFDEENSELASDYIDGLAFDDQGILWIGTGEGLQSYDPISESWELYTYEDVEGFSSSIEGIAFTPDRTMWVAFSSGLCLFDPLDGTCLEDFDTGDVENMVDDWISTLLVDENGYLFYGTDSSGVSMYDGQLWTQYAFENEPLGDNTVHAFVEDSQGYFWVGTSNGGTTRISPDGETWEVFADWESGINSRWINDIAAGPDGVWFLHGTSLSYYDGSDWTHVTKEDGMRDDSSYHLALDDTGQLWIGGYDGLSIYNPSDGSFTHVTIDDGLPENTNVRAFMPEGETMWVGTSTGLFRFNGADFEHIYDGDNPEVDNENFGSLLRLADGNMLLAHSWGIDVYDGTSLSPMDDAPDSVVALAQDIDGSIWSGSEGLHRFDGASWQTLGVLDGIPHVDINVVHIDTQGVLWVGGGASSRGGGLLRWPGER